MHITITHDSEHIRIAERLFLNNSLENPNVIGLYAMMVEFNSKGIVPLILLEGKEKYNEIGTAARVLKVAKSRRFGVSTYILLLEGLCRIHLERISESLPYNQWEV